MIYPGRKSKSGGQFCGLQQTTDLYSDGTKIRPTFGRLGGEASNAPSQRTQN